MLEAKLVLINVLVLVHLCLLEYRIACLHAYTLEVHTRAGLAPDTLVPNLYVLDMYSHCHAYTWTYTQIDALTHAHFTQAQYYPNMHANTLAH